MARRIEVLLAALAVLSLAACTAGDPRFSEAAPAGFWVGLWHGLISCITLLIGIFVDSMRVYEVNNTGGWYDFGFLLGAGCVWGGGSHSYHRSGRKRREDREWQLIGAKVEDKLRRRIRQWAEAEPDEQWDVVEAKAEAKLKRKLREWAEED